MHMPVQYHKKRILLCSVCFFDLNPDHSDAHDVQALEDFCPFFLSGTSYETKMSRMVRNMKKMQDGFYLIPDHRGIKHASSKL
jgi:hypothetical protein